MSRTRGNPVETVIMSWPWGAYLGEGSQDNGITAKISSWKRVGPNVIPHVSKATGIYLNSMLATTEARRGGYDEAILLTDDGTSPTAPARTSSSSRTGHPHAAALDVDPAGITRDSVIAIARELGYVVEETAHPRRPDLADEVFMTAQPPR